MGQAWMTPVLTESDSNAKLMMVRVRPLSERKENSVAGNHGPSSTTMLTTASNSLKKLESKSTPLETKLVSPVWKSGCAQLIKAKVTKLLMLWKTMPMKVVKAKARARAKAKVVKHEH